MCRRLEADPMSDSDATGDQPIVLRLLRGGTCGGWDSVVYAAPLMLGLCAFYAFMYFAIQKIQEAREAKRTNTSST